MFWLVEYVLLDEPTPRELHVGSVRAADVEQAKLVLHGLMPGERISVVDVRQARNEPGS